jgi:hypothetical protein
MPEAINVGLKTNALRELVVGDRTKTEWELGFEFQSGTAACFTRQA